MGRKKNTQQYVSSTHEENVTKQLRKAHLHEIPTIGLTREGGITDLPTKSYKFWENWHWWPKGYDHEVSFLKNLRNAPSTNKNGKEHWNLHTFCKVPIFELWGSMITVFVIASIAAIARGTVADTFAEALLIGMASGLIMFVTLTKYLGCYNPMVSLLLGLIGAKSWFQIIILELPAQFAGSFAAAGLVRLFFESFDSKLGTPLYDQLIYDWGQAFLFESLFAFGLGMIILWGLVWGKSKNPALAIGMYVGVANMLGYFTTGSSLNIIRHLGPAALSNEVFISGSGIDVGPYYVASVAYLLVAVVWYLQNLTFFFSYHDSAGDEGNQFGEDTVYNKYRANKKMNMIRGSVMSNTNNSNINNKNVEINL